MANYNDIKYPNAVSSNATGLGGAWTHIKTQTVTSGSSVSAVDFIHGTSGVVLDATYEIYLITFTMVHPSVQKPELRWHPGDGDFTDTKLSVHWITRSTATVDGGNDKAVVVGYDDSAHSVQATGGETVSNNVGYENEKSGSGHIYLQGAGETDQWKSYCFDTVSDAHGYNDEMESNHGGGNIQQTGAIDRFRFDFSSGNIDVGIFSLYGLKES